MYSNLPLLFFFPHNKEDALSQAEEVEQSPSVPNGLFDGDQSCQEEQWAGLLVP